MLAELTYKKSVGKEIKGPDVCSPGLAWQVPGTLSLDPQELDQRGTRVAFIPKPTPKKP